MSIRLLPFRQYAEEDVVNLFANDAANNSVTDSGDGDAGVFVTVSAGDFGLDPVQYETNSYLGKTDYPFIGRDQYPVVPLKVTAASAGESCVGVTLLQTAQYDENGEKLLYYPQKKLEVQAVLTGEAVPILGKGIVTLDSATAVDGSPGAGDWLTLSSNAGKITGVSTIPVHTGEAGSIQVIGQVLATGQRINRGVSPDQFAGPSIGNGAVVAGSGDYIVARINC